MERCAILHGSFIGTRAVAAIDIPNKWGVSNRAGVARAELGSSVGQGYDLGRSGTPRCVL